MSQTPHADVASEGSSGGTGSGLLGFLSSLRVTLALLVVLGIVCALGTLVPAVGDYHDFRRFLVAGLGRGLLALGFDQPFTSPIFRGLVAVLMANLLLCTVRRLPPLLRAWNDPAVPSGDTVLDGAEFRASGTLGGDGEALATAVVAAGYGRAAEVATEGGRRRMLFRRGSLAPLGPQITHVGVLLIFLGGAVGWWVGAEGFGSAPAGGSFDVMEPAYYRLEADLKRVSFEREFLVDVEREGALRSVDVEEFERLGRRAAALRAEMSALEKRPLFTVEVLDAREEHYEAGGVRRWASRVRIRDGGSVAAEGEVEVNAPLSYKGMTLYQHSFEMRRAPSEGGDDALGSLVGTLSLTVGASATPEGLPLTVSADEFFPDFAVVPGPDGAPKAVSRSEELRNPALRATLTVEGDEPQHVFLFAGPPFSIHDDPQSRFALRLKKVTPTGEGPTFALEVRDRRAEADAKGPGTPWTGISIHYDPGTPLVWVGSLLMVLGLLAAFFLEHRRILIEVDGGGRWRLAGLPSKFPGLFRDEFERVLGLIQGSGAEVDGLRRNGGDAC